MIGLLLAGLALAGDCPLGVVVPADSLEVAVQVEEGRFVGVGSLVRDAGLRCEGGQLVELLAVDGWVRLFEGELVAPPARVCLPPQHLEPLGDRVLQVQSTEVAPAIRLEPGTLVGCDDLDSLSPTELQAMRPMTLAQVRAHARLPSSPVSEWGYVGLPLAHLLTPEEIEAEWEREGLVTDEQREKATSALGPGQPEPIYTHFTGADPHLTDLWGQPEAVERLVHLATTWYAWCTTELAQADQRAGRLIYGATPRTCTVQIGDLAWYGPKEPDPLGHHGHSTGWCADIRLFRTDGSRYEAWWNKPDDRPGRGHAYARNLTGAFIHHALSSGLVEELFFNDPVIVEVLEGVEAVPRHDDHIHLCLRGR